MNFLSNTKEATVSKKISLVVIFLFSTLFFAATTHAVQYYLHYPGNSILPNYPTYFYERNTQYGYFNHEDTIKGMYSTPVNFNTPFSGTFFIKSMGIRFRDSISDGHMEVKLIRRNIFSGADAVVAEWDSGLTASNSIAQTVNVGTTTGYKLIDTKKFCYWLYVSFYKTGGNPGLNLILYQVRIHYGT
jgi:hypothetical protein